MYTTTGAVYAVTVNFDTSEYSISGTPAPLSGRFRADTAAAGTFVFQPAGSTEGTARFRTANDLLVGSYDFGGGARPFVAARKFAKSVGDAARLYNNVGVNWDAGVADNRVFASRINTDSTLQVCDANSIAAMASCPAASVLTYSLTLTDDVFTATRTGDSFKFQVAQAGNDWIYLRGTEAATGVPGRFRIGLVESAAFPVGSSAGGNTIGDWGTVTLTGTSAAATGYRMEGVDVRGMPFTNTGSLAGSAPGQPAGIRFVSAANGAATGFSIQGDQLVVFGGLRGGTRAGFVQITSR